MLTWVFNPYHAKYAYMHSEILAFFWKKKKKKKICLRWDSNPDP